MSACGPTTVVGILFDYKGSEHPVELWPNYGIVIPSRVTTNGSILQAIDYVEQMVTRTDEFRGRFVEKHPMSDWVRLYWEKSGLCQVCGGHIVRGECYYRDRKHPEFSALGERTTPAATPERQPEAGSERRDRSPGEGC